MRRGGSAARLASGLPGGNLEEWPAQVRGSLWAWEATPATAGYLGVVPRAANL